MEEKIKKENGEHNKKKAMTDKALGANRENSKKAQLERIEKGESYLEPNTKHGILATIKVLPEIESQEQWDEFVMKVKESLKPEGEMETILCERIANLVWRIRRLQRYENTSIEMAMRKARNSVMKSVYSWYKEVYKNSRDYVDRDISKLDQLRKEVNDFRKSKEAFDVFDKANPEDLLSTDTSGYVFTSVLDYLYFFMKTTDPANLPGTPLEIYDLDELWPGFFEDTNDITKAALDEILQKVSEKSKVPYVVLMYYAKVFVVDGYYSIKEHLKNYEEKIEESVNNAMIDYPESEKIIRMESHLQRLFTQTFHEYQRLKGMKAGISKPPEAIDFTGIESK